MAEGFADNFVLHSNQAVKVSVEIDSLCNRMVAVVDFGSQLALVQLETLSAFVSQDLACKWFCL